MGYILFIGWQLGSDFSKFGRFLPSLGELVATLSKESMTYIAVGVFLCEDF